MVCSVLVSVQLGFGNESQRSKLNCDSYSVQWLCEGKIYFVFNFWKTSQKQFDGSSMTPFPTLDDEVDIEKLLSTQPLLSVARCHHGFCETPSAPPFGHGRREPGRHPVRVLHSRSERRGHHFRLG